METTVEEGYTLRNRMANQPIENENDPMYENETALIKTLKAALESEDVWVSECYSAYCYLKWIDVYKFSNDPTPKRNRLCARDEKGRYSYEILSIRIKPHGAYEEAVGVQRRYSDKYNDEHIERFEWDEKKEFKLHGYPCAKYTLSQSSMDKIAAYCKSIVDTYEP